MNLNDSQVGMTLRGVEWVTFSDGAQIALVCFLTDTAILTPAGERPVQSLRAGDLVLTASGATRPIRWVGHRRVDLARHPRPDQARPILIRAGALGPGMPHRDLRVSPEHALLVDGVLVAAMHLVDGEAILPDPMARGALTYWHVELDSHDILLADGARAESYADHGNRDLFDNGGIAIALHPDFAALAARETQSPDYAPRLGPGPALDVLRGRLAAARSARRADAQGGRGRSAAAAR